MRKAGILVAAGIAVAVAGYWYWSPYVAIRSARAAAATGNFDKAGQYIDAERVRGAFKAALSAKLIASMPPASDGSMAAAGARIGMLAGGAMMEAAVASAVSPQALMQIVAAGQPVANQSTGGPAKWAIDRPTLDKVVASPTFQDGLPDQSRVRFVWERSGFFTWRLTEIRMPGFE